MEFLQDRTVLFDHAVIVRSQLRSKLLLECLIQFLQILLFILLTGLHHTDNIHVHHPLLTIHQSKIISHALLLVRQVLFLQKTLYVRILLELLVLSASLLLSVKCDKRIIVDLHIIRGQALAQGTQKILFPHGGNTFLFDRFLPLWFCFLSGSLLFPGNILLI